MSEEIKYSISGGQQGAVGDNATAHNFTQTQAAQSSTAPVDLAVLASQLQQLAVAAQERATDPEHQMAIGAIQAAKSAAEKGDESKAISFLKTAGKWALDIATDIGAKVAAELLKKQMGIG